MNNNIYEAKDVKVRDMSLIKYAEAIPHMLAYQIVTKVILMAVVSGGTFLIYSLLNSLDVGAITNMDLPLLLRSWQGIIIMFLLLLILTGYTIMDINGMILLADCILHRKKKNILAIILEAFCSMKYMLAPYGVLLVIYIALLAPISMAFYGISITEDFYIPDFILSVVKANAAYYIPYYIVLAVLAVFAFFHVYCFHFMILRKMKIRQAMKLSRATLRVHWKNFLKRYGFFIIKSVGLVLILALVLIIIPFGFALLVVKAQFVKRFLLVFLLMHTSIMVTLLRGLFLPFQMLELSRIYESYTMEDEGEFLTPRHSLHIIFWTAAVIVYAVVIVSSYIAATQFDSIFHDVSEHKIIAHRAGGSLGNENTMVALDAAVDADVYAAEIDVQRTKDDKYVVFHDNTLNRLCGVSGAIKDYTLDQLKDLAVIDEFHIGGDTAPLATPEEMLEGCKEGNLHLYLELKGKTADAKMAEDMYQLVKEYDMLDHVTFICLKYSILKKLKENHPDAKTGYLCFVAVGNISKLNVDELLLEDELATEKTISKAHAAGKKVFVWTVNSENTLANRLTDSSDGVITDQVTLAENVTEKLSEDSDFSAIFRELVKVFQK